MGYQYDNPYEEITWDDLTTEEKNVELEKLLKEDAARIRELEDALREIKDTQGKVCKNYEICQHISCSSSYSSWAIADKALSEKSSQKD